MIPARIKVHSMPGAHLSVGALEAGRAVVEVAARGEASASTVELSAGEVLMAIEAFVTVYANLCGADPYSLARGVNRTVANRTRAARERRAAAAKEGQL